MSRPSALSRPGFTLRSWRAGDGPGLFRAIEASRLHLMPWMPWVDHHRCAQDSEDYALGAFARYQAEQELAMGIFSPEGRVLGGTGYRATGASLARGSVDIGMWIRLESAGQGLGFAVLCSLLEWGFGEWGLERQAWRCETQNYASAGLARKAGMVQEAALVKDQRNVLGQPVEHYEFVAVRGWVAPVSGAAAV